MHIRLSGFVFHSLTLQILLLSVLLSLLVKLKYLFTAPEVDMVKREVKAELMRDFRRKEGI